MVKDSKVNYTGKSVRPLHTNVDVQITRPGTAVTSPAGPAIGCSDDTRCDIKWEVYLESNSCPCAFNISCCTNGVTLSFWWHFNLTSAVYYRLYLDIGGIYVFYIRSYTANVMSVRVYGSRDLQWFNYIPFPNGLWRHVVIMIMSNEMTMYLDGRYRDTRGVAPGDLNWFQGATELTPRIWLKSTTGKYSFGKLQLWENKKSALLVWRHHYEELEANTMD